MKWSPVPLEAVDPSVADQVMHQALTGAEKETAAFARAAVNHCHDANLGLTPRLAMALGQLVCERASAEGRAVWEAVFSRIGEALKVGIGVNQGEKVLALAFRSMPIYGLFRIVKPLLAAALVAIDRNLIFWGEATDPSPSVAEYEKYDFQLGESLDNLIGHRGDQWDLFWQERGLTLLHFARQPIQARQKHRGLPQADTRLLRTILQPVPRHKKQPGGRSRLRMAQVSGRTRKTAQVSEGGVDGVRLTRQPEDLNRMLASEWLHHPFILGDRLLNSGFLALRREPRNLRWKDVLIVGIFGPGFQNPAKTELKEQWVQYVRLVIPKLAEANLFRSEFVWLESVAPGGAQLSRYFMPEPLGGARLRPSQPAEVQAGSLLDWVPTFTDLQAWPNVQPDPLPEIKSSTDPKQGIFKEWQYWLEGVWKALEHQRPREGSRDAGDRRPTGLRGSEPFALVQVLIALPLTSLEQAQRRSLFLRFQRFLRSKTAGQFNLVILWVGSQRADADFWLLETRDGEVRLDASMEHRKEAVPSVSEQIQDLWLNLIMEELDHAG